MKLIAIIDQIIDLLNQCDLPEHALWLAERKKNLNKKNIKYFATLREIKNIIAGMGSFNDLVLIPRKKTGISANEARKRQEELINQLDKKIYNELKLKF